MNTKIKFTYKDVPYVLEYDRDIISTLEEAGFSAKEFANAPMKNLNLAFKGAFLKNHRKTKDTVIDEIYDNMKDKDKLISTLLTMIDECYATLFDEEDNEGNIEWDTVGLK
jgi:hypothetical protein